MNRSLFLCSGIVLLTVAALQSETAKEPASDSATAAFDRLKTLAGNWEADTKYGKAHLNYKLVSGGTALVERESAEKMPEMLTVYTASDGRVLLTHYCMMGNQPRMQARGFDPATNQISFEFLDAGNLPDPRAGHMHSAKMRLVDNDHLVNEWQFYDNGTPKSTETVQYTRVQ